MTCLLEPIITSTKLMGNYNTFYKASELVAINIHLRRPQK